MPKADCGHEYKSPGHAGGSAGYATDGDTGKTLCYPCSDALEREYLATHDKMTAYLSGDGKTITTWPGGHLARVTESVTRAVGFGWKPTRIYGRAVDTAGKGWAFTSSGHGMIARLRRLKGR